MELYILKQIAIAISSIESMMLSMTCKDLYTNIIPYIKDKKRQSLIFINDFLNLYYQYPNGNKEGMYILFYPNKISPKIICFYNNGELEGPYEKYHNNRIISKKLNYRNNKKEGKCEKFNSNGWDQSLCTYINNKKEGIMHYYNGFLGCIIYKTEYYHNNIKL